MSKGHRTVVGEALLNEHMPVEPAHLVNGKHPDAAEACGCDRQNLALGNVGTEIALRVTLQTVERDIARGDVAFQRAAGEVGIGSFRLKETVLDELVLDRAVGAHLAAGRIAAVEAHKGVGQGVIELALNLLFPHLRRDGVVDVEDGDGILGDAGADVLGERAVDVDLAAHGNAAGSQTGVHIAGLKAELLRESGPALVGKGDVLARALVLLRPVEQGQLKLRHALQKLGIIAALAHLGGHVRANSGDALIAIMSLVADQQVKLGVLFDLHAELVQALNGRVAGEEILRARSEGDDLQVLQSDDDPGDRDKLGNFVGQLPGGTHRIFRNIALQMAHAQVVGAVQHAAVGVAAAVDHVAVALGGGDEHHRAVKVFGIHSFVLISQQFHNERAVYLAEHLGLDIDHLAGYNAADATSGTSFLTYIREYFARVKVFIDLLTGKEPATYE